MFGLIKIIFIGSLTAVGNGSNNAKCVLLSNKKCMIQPTLINLILMNESRISLLSICSWIR